MQFQSADTTAEIRRIEASLDTFRALMVEVRNEIAFAHYLENEAALELQQSRTLLARSKRAIENSRRLLNVQRHASENN